MKHIRLLRSLVLFITLMAFAVGCGPLGKPGGGEADFTGQITEIQRIGRGDVLGQVLVEARVVREDTEYIDKYMLTVNDETLIFEGDGGDRRPATFEALAIGQRVQVWFSGPVKESYPAQVDAGQIVIVK